MNSLAFAGKILHLFGWTIFCTEAIPFCTAALVLYISLVALNSNMDAMAINPAHVCKNILGIKNSHQNIANNVKSDNCKLTSEKMQL